MPARTVNHHDDVLMGVVCRDLIEKQLHALGVTCGTYQVIEFASADIRSTVGVGGLLRQHAFAKWVYWLGGPAPTHVRDTPKLGLVLKHQLDGFVLPPIFWDFGERFGEFLFHSS